MTFLEFWKNNNVESIFVNTTGGSSELFHNVDTDCDEDYCDLFELVNEQQFDFLDDLEGEVIDGDWQWDGEGDFRYLTNSVTKVQVTTQISR